MIQTKQKVKASTGPASMRPSYIFTNTAVSILIIDGREIKIKSVGALDFDNLETLFRKMKRGEAKMKPPQKHILIYLIDNVDGLLWVLILLILTLGLLWHLDF